MAGCGIYWDGGKEARGASGHLPAARWEALPLITLKEESPTSRQCLNPWTYLGLADEDEREGPPLFGVVDRSECHDDS